MLQVNNRSPFLPSINLASDEQGVETLYVVIKGTFQLRSKPALAEPQLPPQLEDVHWAEPDTSSLRYQSELHLGKPATDIIVNGHAYAPGGRPVRQVDCGVKVGDHSRIARVFGDRTWNGETPGVPDAFERLPLRYENAYGGVYVDGDEEENGEPVEKVVSLATNPVGRGYRKKKSTPLPDERLPNLENPRQLIQHPQDRPEPMGFGFVAPTWEPRLSQAGTYGEAWQKQRAPYLPEDFDKRFFNAAPGPMIVPGFVRGGEEVALVNISPRGRIHFRLPRFTVRCEIELAGQAEAPPVHLETVLFEPDEDRYSLTWRTQLACDKQALKIREIGIHARLEDD